MSNACKQEFGSLEVTLELLATTAVVVLTAKRAGGYDDDAGHKST
jgi:hypothetical protein